MKKLQHTFCFIFIAICILIHLSENQAIAATCNSGNLQLTYTTNCFEANAYGTSHYKLTAKVEGGTLPYKVRFNEMIPFTINEEGGDVSTSINDGQGFQIEVVDAEGATVFAEEVEVMPCAERCENTGLTVSVECREDDWGILQVAAQNANGELTYEGYGHNSMLPKGTEYHIVAWDEQGCRFEASGFVCPPPIRAKGDYVNAIIGEPTSIHVLANDEGDDLKLLSILSEPSRGSILELNYETGEIVYVSDEGGNYTNDYIVYEAIDKYGQISQTTVSIFLQESIYDMLVWVERDCTNAPEFGTYVLNIVVAGGMPPYTISGTINKVLQTPEIMFVTIEDGNLYEISVIDAIGNEFFEIGGEIACGTGCFGFGGVSIASHQQVLTCQCDGSVLIDFEKPINEYGYQLETLDGVWVDEMGVHHPLENGQMVPYGPHFIMVDGFWDEYGEYYPIDMGCGSFSVWVDYICEVSEVIVARNDEIQMSQNHTIEFDLTANDELENAEIEITSADLQYGELVHVNPAGMITYRSHEVGTEQFSYRLVSGYNCYEEATVSIEISVCEASDRVVAADDALRMVQNQTIEVDLTANDEAENPYIEIDANSLQYGELIEVLPSGKITYQSHQIGTEHFSYRLIDEEGCYETAMVSIEVLRGLEATWKRNCELWQEDLYRLRFKIKDGIPPYQLSGTVETRLEEAGEVELFLEDGEGFYLEVVDSGGNQVEINEREIGSCESACQNLEIIPHVECLANGEAARLTFEVVGTNGSYTFSGTAQNQVLQNGESYQLEVTDGYGCNYQVVGTVDCQFTSIENTILSNLQLFPNPNNGKFALSLQLPQAEEIEIEVFNALGQVKLWQRLHALPTVERHDFNLDVSSGLYFIRISGKDWVWTEKMVVE